MATMSAALPRIALLSLGGTIASRVDVRGRGAALGLDAGDLVEALPMLADIAEITPIAFRLEMSSNLTPADILALAAEIKASAGRYDGFIVTQGTDSIEETAYLLDLLLPAGLAVVVTGAMRNPGKPGEDGPANLVGAIRVAADGGSRNSGVVVMLDDAIHLARFVRKTHTSATHAFASPSLGPIGYLVEDRVRIPLKPRRAAPYFDLPTDTALPDVALIELSIGDGDRLLKAIPDAGYKGLVVDAFGAGHAPPRLLPALEDLAARMPVVFASRTGSGELYQYLGHYPGSEGYLIDKGLVCSVGLDARKARLLLMLLIATGADSTAIAAAFEAASI
jgi:L-asparaginase